MAFHYYIFKIGLVGRDEIGVLWGRLPAFGEAGNCGKVETVGSQVTVTR